MKAFVKVTLFTTALLATQLAGAAVYKYIDENGNVAYGDRPVEGSEEVKIHGIKLSSSESSDESSDESDDGDAGSTGDDSEQVNYRDLVVLTPRKGKVLDGDAEAVQIILQPTPALGGSDTLVINLDGKDVNKGREVNLSVQNMRDGTHTVSGRILNSDGDVVIESPAVTFTVGG